MTHVKSFRTLLGLTNTDKQSNTVIWETASSERRVRRMGVSGKLKKKKRIKIRDSK